MESALFISENDNQIFYIFGGLGNYGILKDLWSFNLNLFIWELQETFNKFTPIYSYAYTSFDYNSHFYFCIHGGYDFRRNLNLDLFMYNLFRLNITSLKWTSLINIGNDTAQLTSIVYYNNSIYVATSYDSILLYRYDLDDNQIEYIGDIGSYFYVISLSYYFYFFSNEKGLYRMELSSNYSILEMPFGVNLSASFAGTNETLCFFFRFWCKQ